MQPPTPGSAAARYRSAEYRCLKMILMSDSSSLENTNSTKSRPSVRRPRALMLLTPDTGDQIYPLEVREALAEFVDIRPGFVEGKSWREIASEMQSMDVLFTGWGAPVLDADFLRSAPNLKAVFYGAGSVKNTVTDDFWKRKIPLVSAGSANAIPVMEFALAQIILLLKDAYRFAQAVRTTRTWVKHWPVRGAFRSTVGLVSLGAIGSLLANRLKAFDVHVVAYDPFLSEAQARELGVKLVSLEELMAQSDVVSVHTPLLPETRGMIDEGLLTSMKKGASLINTARGAVIDQEALTRVLQRRDDLFAVLDVMWPQPPPKESPLFSLSNVVITPHIAGSMYGECARMGWLVLEELKRFLAGKSLHAEIRQSMLPRKA